MRKATQFFLCIPLKIHYSITHSQCIFSSILKSSLTHLTSSSEVNFKWLWITITIVYIHPLNGYRELNSSFHQYDCMLYMLHMKLWVTEHDFRKNFYYLYFIYYYNYYMGKANTCRYSCKQTRVDLIVNKLYDSKNVSTNGIKRPKVCILVGIIIKQLFLNTLYETLIVGEWVEHGRTFQSIFIV